MAKLISRLTFGLVLVAISALSQPIDHFSITGIPNSITSNVPFTISVTAVSKDAARLTNWAGQVGLMAYSGLPSKPVITEILGSGHGIEVGNPGIYALDLSGWELEICREYGVYNRPPCDARFRFPPGTLLQGQSVLTWSDVTFPPGNFLAFVSSTAFPSIGRYDISGRIFAVARLVNPNGEIIDEVNLGSSSSSDTALWRGYGLHHYMPSCATNQSYSRTGQANHFRSMDWEVGTPSLGRLNSGMQTPWSSLRQPLSVIPSSIQLTNGTWNGQVTFLSGSSSLAWLEADTGTGIFGMSTNLQIVASPAIQMILPATASAASEATAGFCGNLTLLLPSVATNDLAVTIVTSDTNEFSIAPTGIIPTGSDTLVIPITNRDDSVADGDAVVRVVATVQGYLPVSATLTNADDEPTRVFVIAPTVLAENAGFSQEPGQVFIQGTAQHDVLVHLKTEAPLEVPDQVIIPKGRSSQAFSIRVEGDSWVNRPGWQACVEGKTGNGPWAKATIEMTDDEDPGYVATIPSAVREGTVATGKIQANAPCEVDRTVTLSCDDPRLRIPENVTLPAGSLTAEFPITPLNDAVPNYAYGARIVLKLGEIVTQYQIVVLDDEVAIGKLDLSYPPAVVFSGVPFLMTANLADFLGQPQLTNTSGQIELRDAGGTAWIEPNINPVQFVDGGFTNNITITGEALGVHLSASAAGFQADSAAFDVLKGCSVQINALDMALNPNSGKLVVSEAAESNTPPRLTEIDPDTGARGRSLDLPLAAKRIAISDNGQVAWLATDSNAFLQIDLRGWTLIKTIKVDASADSAYAQEICILPGETDRFVAATSINSGPWQMTLYAQGLPLPERAPIPSWPGAVIYGRQGEVFCQSYSCLSKFVVTSNSIAASTNIYTDRTSSNPNIVFYDGKIIRGVGEVYRADTLEKVGVFSNYFGSSVAICPDLDRACFIDQSSFRVYKLSDKRLLGSHRFPSSYLDPSRFLRVGQTAFATLTSGKLSLFQSPLLSTNLPDLVLTAHVPETHVIFKEYTLFDWEFGVTNRGVGPAPAVRLALDSGETFALGTLAPGAGVSVIVKRDAKLGPVKAVVTAQSLAEDANFEDNTVSVVTRVQGQNSPSCSQIGLAMTHLIASPKGDRLYAAVSKSAGDVTDGVAVVDPETATITQMIPIGPDPKRLAISPDGNRLYCICGTNQLLRWNFATSNIDLAITFTNENLLDVLPLSGASNSFVVGTSARIAVFDGDRQRPVCFTAQADRRYLGFASGLLWCSEPNHLRSFAVDSSGLSLQADNPSTLFSDYYPFSSDGTNLYFVGAIFDTKSGVRTQGFLNGGIPDIPNSSLFSAVGYTIEKYSLANRELIAQQSLLLAAYPNYISDLVRWGTAGLAANCGTTLLILRTPLINDPVEADLGVTISPPANPSPNEIAEWVISVTNHSDAAAPRALISVAVQGGFRDLQLEGPGYYNGYQNISVDITNVPPHSSITLKVRMLCFTSISISASVLAGAADPSPTNNTASSYTSVEYPTADLSIIAASAPSRAAEGDEIEVTFVVTNAGPGTAKSTSILLISVPTAQYLHVKGDLTATNAYGPTLGALAPGQTESVVLCYKVLTPGIIPISGYARGSVSDPVPSNDNRAVFIYVPPTDTNEDLTAFTFPEHSILAWEQSRRKVLAAFPDHSHSLFVLDPATLEPLREIPTPGLPEYIVPCNTNGLVWVSLAGGSAVRVNIETGSIDIDFAYSPYQSPVYSVATPPGNPDVLLAEFDPDFRGNEHIEAFNKGKSFASYGPIPWTGSPANMVFSPDGRLFVSVSQTLRELRLQDNALVEIRRKYPFEDYGQVLTYAAGKLFSFVGQAVDLSTFTVDDRLMYSNPFAADAETGIAYSLGAEMTISRIDAASLALQWRKNFGVTNSTASSIVPMGTNGCLVTGDKVWVMKPGRLGIPQPDLAVAISNTNGLIDTTSPFQIQVAITNKSHWTAQGALLSLELPEGLVFSAETPGAGSSTKTFQLGDFDGSTNITVAISALTNGTFDFKARVNSSAADLVPEDNEQNLTIAVSAAPVCIFLFDDVAVREGSSSAGVMTGWLSSPPKTNVTVTWTVSPITPQKQNFSLLSGTLNFSPGQTRAYFSPIWADYTPDLDKTALLTFSSTDVQVLKTNAILTIVNDDFPQVTVSNLNILEGNSGTTNAVMTVSLSATAPFPVSVRFGLTPVTATPEIDYIPRQGLLQFAPGEKLKTVSIPVIGNTIFEPKKTVKFSVIETENAVTPTAPALLTILNDDAPPVPSIRLSQEANNIVIRFQSAPDAIYYLQTRTNLTTDPWHWYYPIVHGDGNEQQFTVSPSSQKQGYYRVFAQ